MAKRFSFFYLRFNFKLKIVIVLYEKTYKTCFFFFLSLSLILLYEEKGLNGPFENANSVLSGKNNNKIYYKNVQK